MASGEVFGTPTAVYTAVRVKVPLHEHRSCYAIPLVAADEICKEGMSETR